MCILCVIQKWCRRVATMLPWLVIPLIGLWALSQILPPAFRFEITSPKLACVFVLLVTLFWYEILMPKLSSWRVRRNARLRERKRFEAIELHKMRKTATRRCRNCFAAYKDQNPGGGRFMCSCCGHISKRPVLDLPVPTGGMGISNSGIIKDLVGKGGKILNGRGWSENGWMCAQDLLENGNWVGGPIAGKSNYLWKNGNGNGNFGEDENCLAEKSYSGVVFFACKLLTSFFLSIRWLWRKIFRITSSREDAASDAEHRAMLVKRGENGANYHESRGEKARRKAEEKRQARLEKELLEEEERKQREEVARLVEERRRLRDEKMEAEKERGKTSLIVKEKDSKKESERKRQERRNEKDKLSSKSNSDAEELEKRAGKENERKRDFDKKSENDRREHQKFGADIIKGHGVETGLGGKNSSTNNYNRGYAGTRYLDQMKGTFLYSSEAFSRGSFFGKGVNTPVIAKENNSNSSVDFFHPAADKKDFYPSERVAGKIPNGDDKSISRPVLFEPQSRTTPKKSWQQLFTRSSSVPPTSNANVISRPNSKFSTEAESPPLPVQSSSIQTFDNPINFGLPSPFTLSSYPNVTTSSNLGFSPIIEPVLLGVGDGPHEFVPEEMEHFEDPCYDPDPISLLGPVSESLDNFQLDLGTGFPTDTGLGRSHALKNVSSSEGSKPSPIECFLSRLKVADDKHNNSNWFPNTTKAQDTHTFPVDDADANEKGTWQIWNSTPLGQEGLAMVGGPPGWILPPEQNRSNKEDFVHPSSQKTMASLFKKGDHVLPGTHSPQKGFFGSGQNGGTFSPVTGSTDHDCWMQNAFFPPLSGNDHFSERPTEDSTQNEMIFGGPTAFATDHSFENSPANCWPKKDWVPQGMGETVGKSSVSRPHIGGLFRATPDVQSLWSFD